MTILFIIAIIAIVSMNIVVINASTPKKVWANKRYVNQIIYKDAASGRKKEVLYASEVFAAPRTRILNHYNYAYNNQLVILMED